MPGLFVHDWGTTLIRECHTVSMVKIRARLKSRREITGCPARHKARALRSESARSRHIPSSQFPVTTRRRANV